MLCLRPSHSHYGRVSWLFPACDLNRNRAERGCVPFLKAAAPERDLLVFKRYFSSQPLRRGVKRMVKRIESEKPCVSWLIRAVWGAAAGAVGHGWVVHPAEAAELCSRTFPKRSVRLYVVHLPPGLLSLCPGISELLCRCVIVSRTGSGWSVHPSDRIWIGQNLRMLQLRQEENVAFNR